MKKYYIFLCALICICLQAQQQKSDKIIVEINSVRINSESTNTIHFQTKSRDGLRIRQIPQKDTRALLQILKKDPKAQWTTISKLFKPQSETPLTVTANVKMFDTKCSEFDGGSLSVELTEIVDTILFSVQPSFIGGNSPDLILLKIDVASDGNKLPFRMFSSVLTVLKDNNSIGLWGINFLVDDKEHIFIFFTVTIVAKEQLDKKDEEKDKNN